MKKIQWGGIGVIVVLFVVGLLLIPSGRADTERKYPVSPVFLFTSLAIY